MKELINHITSLLQPCYPEEEARSLAWWIVEEETGLSRSQILCGCKGTTFSPHMQEVVDRLLHFEPIQYIFGHTLWGGLDLKLTPATLIPRPETAELVELVNQSFNRQSSNCQWNVLDVGTGSGCIAIAIKKVHPEWQITGIDISAEAIEVAKENANRNNVEVDFKVADIFSDECEAFYTLHHTPYTIVISNPPYIRESEKVSMKPNVLNFEPSTALFVSDTDPLKFYRRIAELLSCTPYTLHHTPKYLFFEINEAFPQELAAMLEQLGYTDIQISNDIYGKPRIIQGRMA